MYIHEYLPMYTYIYLCIHIIWPFDPNPHCQCQKCTSTGIGRQDIVLQHRDFLAERTCAMSSCALTCAALTMKAQDSHQTCYGTLKFRESCKSPRGGGGGSKVYPSTMKETQTQGPFISDNYNICETHCPQILIFWSLGLGLLDSAYYLGCGQMGSTLINGAAAKVTVFDILGKQGTPWHFWEDTIRLTGVLVGAMVANWLIVTVATLTP